MGICTFNVQMKGKRAQGTIFGLLFIILSIVVYTAEISGSMISFIMGLLACVAVILMVADFEEMFSRGMDFLAKYTMPIFLMHTLFAAPLRSVLLKESYVGSEVQEVLLPDLVSDNPATGKSTNLCKHWRWHSDQSEDDGSHAGEEEADERTGNTVEDLSAGA